VRSPDQVSAAARVFFFVCARFGKPADLHVLNGRCTAHGRL